MEKDLDQLEQSLSLLHRALSRQRRWEEITLQAGVNLDRTSAVILHVLDGPDSKVCKLHQIADKLSLEAAAVTRKTQLLTDAGYIVKEADDKDGRAFNLRLTPKGSAIIKRLYLAKREHLKSTMSGWKPEERKQLVKLLNKFAVDLSPAREIPTKNLNNRNKEEKYGQK